MRPIGDLLEQATAELEQEAEARSVGHKPVPGPATRQIAARAAYHLVCRPASMDPLLARSSHGSEKGKGIEPGQVLQRLASTLPGLHQLAQAIFDGRRGLPVRRLGSESPARDLAEAPGEGEVLDATALRKLALENEPMIADRTAANLITDDSKTLSELVDGVTAIVEVMGERPDDTLPELRYLDERGWADPNNSLKPLTETLSTLNSWHEVHRFINRQRRTDAATQEPTE